MKFFRAIVFVCFTVFLFFSVFSSSVVRDLPASVAPGSSFTVSVKVDLTNGETRYGVEERFPKSFLATSGSDDPGLTPGLAIWVVLQGAQSKTLIYNLTAPLQQGTYTFNGIYYLCKPDTSCTPESIVSGDSSLVVSSAPVGPSCGDNTCNGSETCSSCSKDCGVCVGDCSASSCVSTGECIEAKCVNNSCVLSNRVDGFSCSAGTCVQGKCVVVESKECSSDLEGKCVLVESVGMTCSGGKFVVGCSNKPLLSVDTLSNPVVLGLFVIVGVIAVLVIIISFASSMNWNN